jgi:hypothetical protein
MPASTTWSPSDTAAAQRFWADYQRQHDVAARIGQTAGIDPVARRVWFGKSIKDIVAQLDAAGSATPLYFIRVGSDHYQRKGARR